MFNFKSRADGKGIEYQDFRGTNLDKALEALNKCDILWENVLSIETINRSGTITIRLWLKREA